MQLFLLSRFRLHPEAPEELLHLRRRTVQPNQTETMKFATNTDGCRKEMLFFAGNHLANNRRKVYTVREHHLKGMTWMESKKERILGLFLTFLKIGAFTFGGGYAMIPLIQKEVTERKKWLSDGDILDIVAIAESTPGPIAINSATFVGYKVAGFWGAFCATLGVVLPSFLIIVAISFILSQFQDNQIVQYAFAGIRAGVLALIVKALYSMYRQCPKGVVSYVVMAGAFLAAGFLKVNVLIVIICCAAVGLITSTIAARRVGK